jgi:hypothetical protein
MGLQYQKVMGVTITTNLKSNGYPGLQAISEGKKPFEVAIELGIREVNC